MTAAAEVPALAIIATAALVLAGAAITLIGTLGILRLHNFYQRAHASTLGTTLGTGCIVVASIVYFSALTGRPALHGLLLLVFAIVTPPATLLILVRAARFRETSENQATLTAAQGARPEYPHSANATPPP